MAVGTEGYLSVAGHSCEGIDHHLIQISKTTFGQRRSEDPVMKVAIAPHSSVYVCVNIWVLEDDKMSVEDA